MGVKGRDFEYLGHRQPHFVRERLQVCGGQVAVVVLDQVQVLNEQIGRAGPAAERERDRPPSNAAISSCAPGSSWRPLWKAGERRRPEPGAIRRWFPSFRPPSTIAARSCPSSTVGYHQRAL
jgi:hypothetical protein